jgi:hypothetical protein
MRSFEVRDPRFALLERKALSCTPKRMLIWRRSHYGTGPRFRPLHPALK